MDYTIGIVTTLILAACTSQPSPSGNASGGAASGGASTPTSGSGGGSAVTPDPVDLGNLDQSCTVDAPSPRRLLRLSAEELLQSFAAVGPLPATNLPVALRGSSIPDAPATGLAVTRDFHRDADQVATALADGYGGTLPCAASAFGSDPACTTAFLKSEGVRLLRGRDDDTLFANLAKLAADVAGRSGGATALRYTLRGLLLSPASLYMTEGLDGAKNGAGQTVLSPVELASYLSFRINAHPPSQQLLDALRAEPTLDAGKLARIVAAELGDQTAELTARFLTTWLQVGSISALARDKTKHPQATPQFMQGLQDETLKAVLGLANDGNASWPSLIQGPQQSALLGDAQSDGFAHWGRPGVFALPGMVALMSAADHTNIPRRGRFLLKNLMCETLQSPPPGAAAKEPPGVPGESQRTRFERVGDVPGCNACHARLHPLAFAFEAYDELGAPRLADESGNSVNAAATFDTRSGQALSFQSPAEMLSSVTADKTAQNCFVLSSYRFVARRDERGTNDACILKDLATRARTGGLRLRDLALDTLISTAIAPRAD